METDLLKDDGVSGEKYVTAADVNRMIGNAVAYVRFTVENGDRTAEVAQWESWYRNLVVTSIVLGCLAGAVFTSEMFLVAGGSGSMWRTLVIPSVVFACLFFLALGACLYSKWKVKLLMNELVDWRAGYPREW